MSLNFPSLRSNRLTLRKPASAPSGFDYTVANEFQFIDTLGTWSGHSKHVTRLSLLRGYIAGLDKRGAGMSAEDIARCKARATKYVEECHDD